jgi:hypothetical protein
MWHALERGKTCTGFWWESLKEKGPLERPRRSWENGTKMDLREICWGCEVDSPGSGQGSLVSCCECGEEHSGSGATELIS